MAPLEMLAECSSITIPDPACPALMPPTGEVPLDPNARSISATLEGVSIGCLTLVGIAITTRIFTRIHLIKTFALEDSMMILATIGFVVFVALSLYSIKFGLGKHQWDVTIEDLLKGLRRGYAAQIMYCLAIYTAKIGVLLQIKRIFTGKKRAFVYWASWTAIVLVTCAYTASLFFNIFQCIPVEKTWNPFIAGTCKLKGKGGILDGVVNLVSDLAILAIPTVAITQLQMDLRKKLGVSAIFATGLLACAASAFRLYYSVDRLRTKDQAYWYAVVGCYATAEIAAVLICGCFPTFPRFYKYVRRERNQKWEYETSGSGPSTPDHSRDKGVKAVKLAIRGCAIIQ